jgi:hypothetical protein
MIVDIVYQSIEHLYGIGITAAYAFAKKFEPKFQRILKYFKQEVDKVLLSSIFKVDERNCNFFPQKFSDLIKFITIL